MKKFIHLSHIFYNFFRLQLRTESLDLICYNILDTQILHLSYFMDVKQCKIYKLNSYLEVYFEYLLCFFITFILNKNPVC